MPRVGILLAALAAAMLAPAVAPAANVGVDVESARAGLADAVASGRLGPTQAAAYRRTLRRTASLVRRLPAARAEPLAVVLGEVADRADAYTRPRATTLFGMLDANADRAAGAHSPGRGRTSTATTASCTAPSPARGCSSIRSPTPPG